jgi:predicted transcriptional regulator YheO
VTKINNIKNEPALQEAIEVCSMLNEKDLFDIRDAIYKWLNDI